MAISTEQAEKYLDQHAEALLAGMGLRHWGVSVNFESLDQTVMAMCSTAPGYDHASVRVDLGKIEGEEEFLYTLRHEFFHIYHHQFQIYKDSVEAYLDDNAAEAGATVYFNACEVLVRQLESSFDVLGLSPQALIKVGNERIGRRAGRGPKAAHNRQKRGATPRPATKPKKKKKSSAAIYVMNTGRLVGRG